jgi:ankyrin repeat protein
MDGALTTIPSNNPVAVKLLRAVRHGNVSTISGLLDEQPSLAHTTFVAPDGGTRTALHMAADWPGYYPGAPEVVALLIGAGADPDVPSTDPSGKPSETPLHWAASSDDLEVAAALIEGGADIEAPGGSIAGTPLANAVGYGCWHVARLLVSSGARIGSLWEAAALGDRPKVEEFLADDPRPSAEEINEAFWQACHGGQRRVAELLLARGADINTTTGYSDQTPLRVAANPDTRHQGLLDWLRTRGATTR